MTTKELDFLNMLHQECIEALDPDNAVDSKELTLRVIVGLLKDRMADLIADGEAELASFAPKV